MNNTVDNFQRASDGKFIVKLPFKENLAQLGESRNMAIRRFQTLEIKLAKDVLLKKKYSEFMREYINLGHMSPVCIDDVQSRFTQVNYLPHHGVKKESSTTTKLRVVFDASAKTTTNLSLNDVLKTGPCIQDTLFSILTRFRTHTIVFTADIAKMYRCVLMHKGDRDFQRIVWRFDPSDPLLDYRLNTVTYGTVTASFLATRCLKQLSIENSVNSPKASSSISSDFYMDDWLSGAEDVNTALKLINEVDSILRNAGFILRQWSSNDPIILNQLKVSNNCTDDQYIIKNNEDSKTLGVLWHASKDAFGFIVNKRQQTNTYFTKRIILSIICQIFDPLGLIGPVIVTAKIFLRRLWQLKELDWDDPISNNLITEWLKFYEGLQILNEINIPRHILIKNSITIEIHCFSDASELAYGSCIYARSINSLGEIVVRLICAKSRVAPIKTVSLARLELCAALLSTQLSQNVISAIKLKVNHVYYIGAIQPLR